MGETTWLDRWISSCLFWTLVPAVETIFIFFLECVYENMLEMVQAPPDDDADDDDAPAIKSHRNSRYAKKVELSKARELHASKKVMRGIAFIEKNLCCGFQISPRNIDKVSRNLFPVLVAINLGTLLLEISP